MTKLFNGLLAKPVLAGLTGAMMLTAMPADARPYGRHRDGIDAGDVIAGALIIGGIAAIASAASSNRDRYRGRYGYDEGRDGYDDREAVAQCVRAAQQEASRYGGWARVTDVTGIDRVSGGYEVRGRLVVERRGYGGYDNGWGNDWRSHGWNDGRDGQGWDRDDRWGNRYDRYGDAYDKGRFNCLTRYGRVDDVRIRGLRG
jgi:hypothetical protein